MRLKVGNEMWGNTEGRVRGSALFTGPAVTQLSGSTDLEKMETGGSYAISSSRRTAYRSIKSVSVSDERDDKYTFSYPPELHWPRTVFHF